MPRYDFRCDQCQTCFELSLSLEERDKISSPLKVCPECHSHQVKQLMTTGGILKGGLSHAGGFCGEGGCPMAGSCGGGMCDI